MRSSHPDRLPGNASRGKLSSATTLSPESGYLAYGEDHLDPVWTFGPEGPRYEVEVRGNPSATYTITGFHPHSAAEGLLRNNGVVATANHCVNVIPYVCRAGPGIKSYLDLPLMTGRAHPKYAAAHKF